MKQVITETSTLTFLSGIASKCQTDPGQAQCFVGFEEKISTYDPSVILYQDCSNYADLSKKTTRVIRLYVHLFVCESVTLSLWFLIRFDSFLV